MAVYVDSANISYRNMIMCHMIADTIDELHDMADKIGSKRSWFQKNASFPHYDIPLFRKKEALKHGAILLNRREMALKMREIRKIQGYKRGKTSS